jgi:hypothetical protein
MFGPHLDGESPLPCTYAVTGRLLDGQIGMRGKTEANMSLTFSTSKQIRNENCSAKSIVSLSFFI